MGAQEVHHLNFQAKSVDHNMSFARASTQKDSVELQRGPRGRREIRRDTLTAYGERLDAQTWPPRTMLVNDALRDTPFADFVMDFYVGRNGIISRCRSGAARNRVVTFRPIYSSDPRGDNYPDYCRSRLIRFRPWSSDLANGWGGAEGDVAQTEDPVKRQAMVDAWTDFAERTLLLPEPQRPTGFSAPDLRPAPRRRRRRRHRRVDDTTGDGSTDERDSSSCSQDSEDEPNLDGVYGNAGARPGDLSERRGWQDNDTTIGVGTTG